MKSRLVGFACWALLSACSASTEVPAAPDTTPGTEADACIPTTCETAGANCGEIDDGCGGRLDCGTCGPRETCGGGGTPNTCGCTKTTCAAEKADCGSISDGCGGRLSCGSCAAPQSCAGGGVSNRCGCTPRTCIEAGANCGTITDGCGGTRECGSCPTGQTCGGGGTANVCGSAPCTKTTCAAAGKNCGTISDGCSGTLSCGSCTAPQTCGGGGTANVCGCTPKTCASLGANCSTVSDGCGGTLECGTCAAPQTCGGGGTANVCGCTAKTCTILGANCGTPPDGCGGTLSSCGTCTGLQTCGGGGTPFVCGCTKATCATGDECGSIPDGCGGTTSCGTCGTGFACDTTTRKCVCVPTTCAAAGRTCGTMSDGCGGTLTCSGCSGKCSGTVCEPYDIGNSAVCTTAGWCFQEPMPQPFDLYATYAISATDIYAVGAYGTIIHSDGAKWTGVSGMSPQALTGVWGSGPSDVWVVGNAGVVLRGSESAGWTSVPLPPAAVGKWFTGVWGTSPTNVVIVGGADTASTVLRWNGTALTEVAPPTSAGQLRAVYETSPSSTWVATSQGIYYWNGSTWTNETASETREFRSLWGSGSDVFAIASNGIRRRVGSSWTTMVVPGTTEQPYPSSYALFSGIAGTSATDVYAVGQYLGYYSSDPRRTVVKRWDGLTWHDASPSGSALLRAVTAAPGLNATAVGDWGSIVRTAAGTSRFQSDINSGPTDYPITSISGTSANDLWLGSLWYASSSSSASPYVGLFYYNGSTVVPRRTDSVSAVWALSAGTALYAKADSMSGSTPGIYRTSSSSSGATVELAGTFHGLWGSTAGDVWAVGANGVTQHRVSGTWSNVPNPLSGTTTTLRAVFGLAANDVWAVGDVGVILHWNGTAWSAVTSPTSFPITNIWGSSTNDVWAVSQDKILHWDATSWSVFQTLTSYWATAVGGAGSDVWAVTTGSTLLKLTGGSFVPVATNTNIQLSSVWADATSRTVWLGGEKQRAVSNTF